MLCFTLLITLLSLTASIVYAQDDGAFATEQVDPLVANEQPAETTETPAEPPASEEIPTELPTEPPASPAPQVTEQVVAPLEPPATAPTEIVAPVAVPDITIPQVPATGNVPAEPELFPLFADNFDGALQYTWTLGAGWLLVPNENGQALQVANSEAPATFAHNTIYNVAIQARFLMANGGAALSVRHSDAGSYRASLDRQGNVALYRGDQLVQNAEIGLGDPNAWHTLRVSVIDNAVRIAVDGIEVIAYQDSVPLPAGALAIQGTGSDNLVLVDDFQLWIPALGGGMAQPVGNTAPVTAPPVVAPQVVQEPVVQAARVMPGPFTPSNSHRNVKVLTIAMFEVGQLTGDVPGEAQRWIEGEGMNEVLEIPGSFSPLYCNNRDHCLIITGQGFSNAATTIMALGFNKKVDLSQAYILIAGIAGVDPEDGTIGGAAWADWVVSGDLAHEIDVREMPAHLDYPIFAQACYSSGFCSGRRQVGTEVYQLNTSLVDWAYSLTQNMTLADNPTAQAYRANYPAHLPASQPPSVIRCDALAADTYWHGELLSNWANWWVANWTNGAGNYCMTNQEDSATLTALKRLDDAGLADFSRVLVLRTASNFDQQYPGQAAIASLGTSSGGFFPSTENAYLVGSAVTDYILDNWQQWRNGVPTN